MRKRILLFIIALLLILVGCGSKTKDEKELRYFVLHMDAGDVKTFTSNMKISLDGKMVKEVDSQYTKNGDSWNVNKKTKTLGDATSEEEYKIEEANETAQGENIGKITLRFTDEDCEDVSIKGNQCGFIIKTDSIEKVLGIEAELAEMFIEIDDDDFVVLLQIHYIKESGEDVNISNTYQR